MYNQCLNGVTEVLKLAWQIANGECNDNIDYKTRLQALSLINDCYKHRMDLLTNASVLTDAMKFIEQSKEKLKPSFTNNMRDQIDYAAKEHDSSKENRILKVMRLVNQSQ